MADPSSYRPRPGEVPDSPGVYRFRDEHGRVIYVGKARSLRQRLASYFQDVANLHPRTQTMVTTAASVEWTTVATEVESLQLEYSWIKEFDPRFNVKYRDDKSYPYLAITMGEPVPRVQVMRGAKRKGTRYFGPYTHAWAIRETVDLLLRVFPIRSCSAGVLKRAAQVGRPCLLGYIGKCSAPCVGRISEEDHRALAEDFASFMAGDTSRFVRRLEAEMREASADLDFERAARRRDDLGALRRALEKSAVVLPDATDADVFALAEDELEAAVQVFHVRGGRIRGQRGWVVEKVEDVTTAGLVEHLLQQVYGDADAVADAAAGGAGEAAAGASPGAVPREVLVPVEPADAAQVTAWLSGLRGSAVDVRVPQRGDKRALLETVAKNASQALALHKTRRGGDLTTRSLALQELQDALGLDEAPLRVECYDVSNLQGTEVVASMVVFEDGLPRKGEYRRFAVRGESVRAGDAQDDTAAIHEVMLRRFRRHLADGTPPAGSPPDEDAATGAPGAADAVVAGGAVGDGAVGDGAAREGAVADGAAAHAPVDPESGRPRRFAYPPQLVVVDGGAPQVAAAARALEELGVTDVALCGLAKRLEEVWLPGEEFPVVLPRQSEGLYLLQRVRDEAHRFAITYHRQRRSSSMTRSALDDVPGLGPARRTALLKRFGSLKRLRAATVEEVCEVPGVGPATARAVLDALAPASAASADGAPAPRDGRREDEAAVEAPLRVNTATGELLDD
ncbi:excinuclease ABC subunit UvrC [uncultured Pseudokineococcus sp.]|uniref:excinuclease ABC subunit UvrC n=1 Tax=uncultured Pseudokineococcus sp. TaxID=1642928 RepID=UPI002603EB82|nr:excinuclease ABC subunit UvrC [uncultured Pseudokineococcus sp.]